MRFFSGTRGESGGKKGFASQMFRKQQARKDGPAQTSQDKYQEMMNMRMEKMREEYLMGKKKQCQVPGAKAPKEDEEQPQQMSKKMQDMMKLMAMKKAMKDMKKERKKIEAWKREQKAIKTAQTAEMLRMEMLRRQAELEIEEAKRQAELQYAEQMAAQQAQQPSSSVSPSESNNDSWW